MSRDDLTELLINTLYAMMLNVSEEAGHILPDGFSIQTETANLKITFDIDIDIKCKNPKIIKDFINNCSCHIYKPGDLDE